MMVVTFQCLVLLHMRAQFFFKLMKSPNPVIIDNRSVNVDRHFNLYRYFYFDFFFNFNWLIDINRFINEDRFIDKDGIFVNRFFHEYLFLNYLWYLYLLHNHFWNLFLYFYIFRNFYNLFDQSFGTRNILRNFHFNLNWFFYNNFFFFRYLIIVHLCLFSEYFVLHLQLIEISF